LVTDSNENDTSFSIQKKTGVVLFILVFSTGLINFLSGIINFNDSILNALTHFTTLPLLCSSPIFLITAFFSKSLLRMIQVLIILFFGIYTTALTEPGNLTGSLIILLGILLSYQYGFFSLNFKVKLLTLLIFYVSATLINSLFINRMQLPTGIPSIIFTITAVYLFWTVFQEDIKRYLYQTNQLQDKLVQVEADKKYLNSLASDRLSQIEQQNRILEQRLYEKTELEEQLRHNLAEKEVLLREVNHRVKNNLSIILSMLNLQKGEITNTELKTFIAENQNRIQTLATAHDMVFENENIEAVNLGAYLKSIIRDVSLVYNTLPFAEINNEIDETPVNITTALACGLIVNECLSCSMIRGFQTNQAEKRVIIKGNKLKKKWYEIVIEDNADSIEYSSFSSFFIQNLAEGQLKGSYQYHKKTGNHWFFRFPLET